MKKSILLLFVFTFLFSACSKKEADVDPTATIEGNWNVTTVNSSIENKGTGTQNNNIDLSKEQVFFKFNADGTYSTNAKISLGTVSKSDKTFNGKYTLSGTVLKIDYFLEDFSLNVNFSLDIVELKSNSMAISLTEKSLLTAFNDSIGQLSATNKLIAQAVVGNIVKLNTTINLIR